jgi:transposase-like protein
LSRMACFLAAIVGHRLGKVREPAKVAEVTREAARRQARRAAGVGAADRARDLRLLDDRDHTEMASFKRRVKRDDAAARRHRAALEMAAIEVESEIRRRFAPRLAQPLADDAREAVIRRKTDRTVDAGSAVRAGTSERLVVGAWARRRRRPV